MHTIIIAYQKHNLHTTSLITSNSASLISL